MTVTRVRELRRHLTDAERRLWQHLRYRQLAGHKFRRQVPLGRYIVDFACLEARLVVEVDGGQHLEQSGYDDERDRWLRGEGFVVLRFWNSDVLGNLPGVLTRVREALDRTPKSPHPDLPPQGGKE